MGYCATLFMQGKLLSWPAVLIAGSCDVIEPGVPEFLIDKQSLSDAGA